ncbi:MAG: rhodanese-like domain-containing protein [Planctomycetota bacterium]
MTTLRRALLLAFGGILLGLLRLVTLGEEVAQHPQAMLALLEEETPVYLWTHADVSSQPGVVVVDGRSPEKFARSHPQAAVNLPFEQKEDAVVTAWNRLHGATLVIVMEADRARDARELVSRRMASLGADRGA